MIDMQRQCVRCGAEITACMGFVLARDVVDERRQPRELCGRCGLLLAVKGWYETIIDPWAKYRYMWE